MLVLSVVVFVQALIPGSKAEPKRGRTKDPEGPFRWLASFEIYGLIAAFITLVFLVGFYIAIPVFLFSFLRWVSRLSVFVSGAIAFFIYGFTWFVFSYFLHLEVFSGYLAAYI